MSQPKLLDTPLYSILHKDDVRGFNQERPKDGVIDMRGGDFRGWTCASLTPLAWILPTRISDPPICVAWICVTATGRREPGPCADFRYLLPARTVRDETSCRLILAPAYATVPLKPAAYAPVSRSRTGASRLHD